MEFITHNPFLSGLGIGGAIVGLVGYYLRGWVDDQFKNKSEVRSNKRLLAEKILSIIAEAENSNYQNPPRDRELVKNLAIQTGPFNKNIEDLIRNYDYVWWLASDIYNRKGQAKENEFLYREIEVQAETIAHEVKVIVGKWRK